MRKEYTVSPLLYEIEKNVARTRMELEARGKKRRASEAGFQYTKKGKQLPYAQKQAVRKIIRDDLETKYFDQDFAYTVGTGNNWNSTNSGTMRYLFNPQDGTETNEREGQKVTVHKIHMRGYIWVPKQDGISTVTADNSANVRLILCFDRDCIGGIAAGNQVIRNPNSSNSILANIQPMNIDNIGRFKIVYDKTFRCENPNPIVQGTLGATIDQYGLAYPFKKTIKFKKPVPVDFFKDVASTAQDAILHNNLIAFAHSPDVDLAPAIYGTVRSYYKECKY